jgi:hypothetical protein
MCELYMLALLLAHTTHESIPFLGSLYGRGLEQTSVCCGGSMIRSQIPGFGFWGSLGFRFTKIGIGYVSDK